MISTTLQRLICSKVRNSYLYPLTILVPTNFRVKDYKCQVMMGSLLIVNMAAEEVHKVGGVEVKFDLGDGGRLCAKYRRVEEEEPWSTSMTYSGEAKDEWAKDFLLLMIGVTFYHDDEDKDRFVAKYSKRAFNSQISISGPSVLIGAVGYSYLRGKPSVGTRERQRMVGGYQWR